MSQDTILFQPMAARPAPASQIGPIAWLRANLFGGWKDTAITLSLLAVLLAVVPNLIEWLLINATFLGDDETCRQNAGACWPFLQAKFQVLMVGVYPQDLSWRPAIAALALLVLAGFTYADRIRGIALIVAWAVLPIFALIMIGGAFGRKSTSRFGAG